MSDTLCSVGLDVGTTTTQMVVSRLTVENRAGSFSVPKMEITHRDIFYRSPVVFTPLQQDALVDIPALRQLVTKWYDQAGITPDMVDTGAVIITGETSRKENADRALRALSGFAGRFVAATAGPDLESILAAKGAGACSYAREHHCRVLHMDIGGGTSNLALIQQGEIVQTGCLNVGGRLLKLDEQGRISYLSQELTGLTDLAVGQIPTAIQLRKLAAFLTEALTMAAGLCKLDSRLEALLTRETGKRWEIPEAGAVISFSGGVADCIAEEKDPAAFRDLGVYLGQAIRNSPLCAGDFRLGKETIRATVIGAGCHSASLSGSTVFYRNVPLPLQDLPVVAFSQESQNLPSLPQQIALGLSRLDGNVGMLAFPGWSACGYSQVSLLAERILQGVPEGPIYVCLQGDMAKALGQKMALLAPERPVLCIDSVYLTGEHYLDVGTPVGPALPVVIKTLVLENGGTI